MKAKRVLALILSVAMFMTSGELPVKASAMTDTAETVSYVSEGDLDTNASDVSGGGEETSDVSGADEADNATDVSVNSAETVDVSGNTDVQIDPLENQVSGNDVSEGDVNVQDPAELVASDVEASKYFEVDADGTLKFKTDVTKDSLPGNLSFTLPAGVKKIPVDIFNNNTKIVGVKIPSDSELTEIEAGAFERSSVKNLSLPKTVKKIEQNTFKNSELQAIEFQTGSTLDGIDKEAFAGSGLQRVIIPAGVKVIGEAAFKDCNDLTQVSLVNTEVIGVEGFSGCAKLTQVDWSPKLTQVQDKAFSGCGFKTIKWEAENSEWLTTVEWGNNVFEKCTALATVELPIAIGAIPRGMFYGCTGLSKVTIPRRAVCAYIGQSAFEGCAALQAIDLPENIRQIGSKAFADCDKLSTVTIRQQSYSENGISDVVIAKDAFPLKTLTMKGYEGTVEDYAHERGYSFESLNEKYSITLKRNNNSYGSAELSTKSAKAGTIIEVKVTPNSGYRLKADGLDYDDILITNLKEIIENTSTGDDGTTVKTYTYVFTFEMPDYNTEVHVNFEKNDIGTLKPQFESTGSYGISPKWVSKDSGKSGTLTFLHGGQTHKLVMTGGNASDSTKRYEIGNWMFDFSSSDETAAVIGSDGTIYARNKGNATITAKLKTDSSKKVTFSVVVSGSVEKEDLSFAMEYSDYNKAEISEEIIGDETYTVFTYKKSALKDTERDFTANLEIGYAYNSGKLYFPSKWVVSNSGIAYVDNESKNDNQNKIHVRKGAVGETMVTVTVTNGYASSKKNYYKEYYVKKFIIRVIDVTPRLKQSKITVNAKSTEGTEFDVISVYGHEIDKSSLRIVQAVKSNGTTKYESTDESERLKIRYEDGKLYLELADENAKEYVKEKGKDITYTNMYIAGDYTDGEGSFDEVHIKSLVLTSKALKPSIKVSGKLNLFFGKAAHKADRGEVTFTQSLKDLPVDSYELVSTANYAEEGSESIDTFANNFEVSEKGVIIRSDNPLLNAKGEPVNEYGGKPVTNGYLKITYVGYEDDPCYVKITVPTQNKKPAYMLSATKATVSQYGAGYTYKLQILDKKTKKPISLEHLAEVSYDISEKGTTPYVFGALDIDPEEDDTIALQIAQAKKGKAVINVEMDTWSEPMKFTFNLNVNTKTPTVKAKNTTLILNNKSIGRKASTGTIINQTGVTLENLRFEFIGKDAQRTNVNSSRLTFNFDKTTGEFSFCALKSIPKGSYKFKLTPEVSYEDGSTPKDTPKPITVTVKVIDTELKVALKPSTVTLNRQYRGYETAQTTYTIKNLPAGEVELDTEEVKINDESLTSAEEKFGLVFTFDGDDEIKVKQTSSSKLTKGSYKYTVSDLKVLIKTEDEDTGAIRTEKAKIESFVITVKIIDTVGKLNVKAKGSIIIGNSSSNIVYTLQPKNFNANITDQESIVLTELVPGTNSPCDLKDMHFEITDWQRNTSGVITAVTVQAKEGAVFDSKKTYKLQISVVLPDMIASQGVKSGDLNIKAKQVLPKIKTDVTETTMWMGADGKEYRSQDVEIIKTTLESAEIIGVKVSEKNSATIQDAFKVTSFDEETQTATIELKNSALVKANTTYSIKLEAEVKGQVEHTTGPITTLRVKILN